MTARTRGEKFLAHDFLQISYFLVMNTLSVIVLSAPVSRQAASLAGFSSDSYRVGGIRCR